MKYTLIILCLFAYIGASAEVLDSVYYYRVDEGKLVPQRTENFSYKNGLVVRKHTAEYNYPGFLEKTFRHNYTWLEKDLLLTDTLENLIDMKVWRADSNIAITYYDTKLKHTETVYQRGEDPDLYDSHHIYYEYDDQGRIKHRKRVSFFTLKSGELDTTSHCTSYLYNDTSSHEIWNFCAGSEATEIITFLDEAKRPKHMIMFPSGMEDNLQMDIRYHYSRGENDSTYIRNNVKHWVEDFLRLEKEYFIFENEVVRSVEFSTSHDSLQWELHSYTEYTRQEKHYREDTYLYSGDEKELYSSTEEIYNDNGNILRRNYYRYHTGTQELLQTEHYVYAQGNSVEETLPSQPVLRYEPAHDAVVIPESVSIAGAKLVLINLQGAARETPVSLNSVSLPEGLASGIYVIYLADASGKRITGSLTLPLAR